MVRYLRGDIAPGAWTMIDRPEGVDWHAVVTLFRSLFLYLSMLLFFFFSRLRFPAVCPLFREWLPYRPTPGVTESGRGGSRSGSYNEKKRRKKLFVTTDELEWNGMEFMFALLAYARQPSTKSPGPSPLLFFFFFQFSSHRVMKQPGVFNFQLRRL